MPRWLAPVLLAVLAGFVLLRLLLPVPDRGPGTVAGAALAPELVAARDAARAAAAEAVTAPGAGGILFGDLHVHSTYSIDALVYALPVFGGEGAHPPSDACDFARYCAALDFYSMNDHAEGLTPERWRETIESVRQCNATSGSALDPDLVAFVGWEWTQVGRTPETHYGHRNVIFRDLRDDALPTRPITAMEPGAARAPAMVLAGAFEAAARPWLGRYGDFLWLGTQLADLPDCPEGVPVRELPDDCRENASTPAALFEKLAQWGFETLVIPHGLAWGLHAPPGAHLDASLAGDNHVPEQERLLEVFSGHGNSEEYRDLPEAVVGADGERICPAPTPDYLPCCWRAGELIRARCGDLPAAECAARVAEARRLALEAGNEPHLVVPDALPEDWLDCDQCRDCFKPAMSLRPRETAQYSLALSDFDRTEADGRPRRFRWGFIASTDSHKARPGTGYKQYDRKRMTDSRGFTSERADGWLRPYAIGRQQDPQRAQPDPDRARSFRGLLDVERVASFMYPGGIVAVHAGGRDRHAIWDALQRREVYGTSGPRILLWFHLANGPDGAAPMGARVALGEAPVFEVRAVGDFVQQPGCPAHGLRGLPGEHLERLCRGECYHPSDARHRIEAIEVVRVRPQVRPDEPVGPLIEDPWRRLPCPPDPAGCTVRFEDPEFAGAGRDAVYYVRALQEATPAVNGANLRPRRDARGAVAEVSPCHGSWRTPFDEDCLAPVQERAWSSPIWVDHARGGSG